MLAALGAALLGLLVALRLSDGTYTSLVQGWYRPVLVATAALLLCLAAVVAVQTIRRGSRWTVKPTLPGLALALIVIVPLILGFAYSPSPLGSASLDALMEDDGLSPQFSTTAGSTDAANRNLYQWAYEFANADPASIVGDAVDVIGFVYHGEAPRPGQFAIARFVVACCVADARGYTLPVAWIGAADLPDDTWVQVRGRVGTGPEGELVILAEAVEAVAAPANPYIYP